MANKKNKKKAQQPAPANKAAANSKVEAKKAVAKKNEKAAKSKKNEKPGFFARTKKYFASVKSEMKRVTDLTEAKYFLVSSRAPRSISLRSSPR